jgi:hypothetical protein
MSTIRFTPRRTPAPPVPGPRGHVLPFEPPCPRGCFTDARRRLLARAGLAWIGVWLVLLGGVLAAKLTHSAPGVSKENPTKDRPVVRRVPLAG